MTVLHQFETPAATFTPDGCLTTVPPATNDNRPALSPIAAPEKTVLAVVEVDVFDSAHGYVGTESQHREIPASLQPWVGSMRFRQVLASPIVATSPAIRPALSFDHLPSVIALSGAAGSGKSTVSDFLAVRFGYVKTKFARPLKEMMRALGLDDRHIEGDLKETPTDKLDGLTPRYAMQQLGTTWGRDCMGEDFWVNRWRDEALSHAYVLVDDCRFANEATTVRRMGGRVIRLVGRGGIAGSHVSEAGDFIADEVVTNDGSIAELQARVLEVMEGWRV